jgi:hypothetical protein
MISFLRLSALAAALALAAHPRPAGAQNPSPMVESADWLLQSLGLERTPMLRWGPRGMQQLSESGAGRFELLGFAGNSAPDHVDHLHRMPEFLARLRAR